MDQHSVLMSKMILEYIKGMKKLSGDYKNRINREESISFYVQESSMMQIKLQSIVDEIESQMDDYQLCRTVMNTTS